MPATLLLPAHLSAWAVLFARSQPSAPGLALPRRRPQVRIPAHCLTSNNRQVRARQLWGSDVYTEDSDLVAVLMHCGYWYHSRECGKGPGRAGPWRLG